MRLTYFRELLKIIDRTSVKTYKKTLKRLFDTPFEYTMYMDKNRYLDGESLRARLGYDDLDEDVSVLEMMVALALRMEEDIMTDPKYGDRTSQWFWKMFNSLGLNRYDDDNYDEQDVDDIIDDFLDRKYKSNGKGGLFTFNKKPLRDPREVEIWDQMQWWVSEYY